MAEKLTFEKLVKSSGSWYRNNPGVKVQTSDNMCSNMRDKKDRIEEMAGQSRPVIHERVLHLVIDFIKVKQETGSLMERTIYSIMSPTDMVDRLVSKRPLMFMTHVDSWIAKDGSHGAGDWDKKAKINMKDFLTYDEIKLAALVQLSTPTFLINSGSRDNIGRVGTNGTFTQEAVYVGAVGARFEMEGKMEYQDMVVTSKQNTESQGYGEGQGDSVLALFAKFYGKNNLPTYENRSGEVVEVKPGVHLDKEIYISRIQVSAETYLIEANQRGLEKDGDVYCHVVGLGLGVWQLYGGQSELFLEAWTRALDNLAGTLSRVSDIDFSWVSSHSKVEGLNNGEKYGNSSINIHFSRRDPFKKLTGEHKDKLTVAMFAWDGNSYVGNEYWNGLLSASGDPAAACCSLIPELLNPDINPKVRGSNLYIASPKQGLISYNQFIMDDKYIINYSITDKLVFQKY